MIIKESIINDISYTRYENLLKKWDLDEEIPEEIFIVNKGTYYLAIDNRECKFEIAKFNSIDKAIYWLLNTNVFADDVISLNDIAIKKELESYDYDILSNYYFEYKTNY